MAGTGTISACGALELDANGDTIWAWVYPEISLEFRSVIEPKAGLDAELPSNRFVYGRFNELWFYILTTPSSEGTSTDVVCTAIVALAKDFHAEKYEKLCGLMAMQYGSNGGTSDVIVVAFVRCCFIKQQRFHHCWSPQIFSYILVMYLMQSNAVRLVNPSTGLGVQEAFLSVNIRGSYKAADGPSFKVSEFRDVSKTYLKGSIKSLVTRFGIEVILLYIAVLLKSQLTYVLTISRVAIYHRRASSGESLVLNEGPPFNLERVVVVSDEVSELMQIMRTIPQLVFKRQNWNILRPFVSTVC